MKELLENFQMNRNMYVKLMGEHLQITFVAAVIAIILGIIIGIVISEYRKIAAFIMSVVNVLYTIPSIALLGALISWTGIGNVTAIIALTLYALLPIVRSTYTGIMNINEQVIEASVAMGSTSIQTVLKVKLPLALPVIFSGVRSMLTMTIALAGIASFVGAGGLGVAIYRGITTNNQILLLNGSILIAILALVIDMVLGLVERFWLKKRKLKKKGIIAFALVAALSGILVFGQNMMNRQINIASKPTTEGYILAEIVAQLIEEETDLVVKRTHGVGGGTSNLHPALLKGEFDLYPEYTGTSWQIVLKEMLPYKNELFSELVKKYETDYQLTWKGMFGFNNTYGLAVQKEIAEKYNLKTYSDLAAVSKTLTFGAEYDFFEREDGFNALSKAYNLKFKDKIDMDNGLKYQALLDKQIDVMTIFTTDGQLSNPNIVVLEDDLNFYPSYMAGMVVRMATLIQYPELITVLNKLDNIINEETMAYLNNKVETEKKTPEKVAQQFLREQGLVSDK